MRTQAVIMLVAVQYNLPLYLIKVVKISQNVFKVSLPESSFKLTLEIS